MPAASAPILVQPAWCRESAHVARRTGRPIPPFVPDPDVTRDRLLRLRREQAASLHGLRGTLADG